MLKLGLFSYVHSLPLHLGLSCDALQQLELNFGTPYELNYRFHQANSDCSFVSLSQAIDHNYLQAPLGIISTTQIKSVLLHVKPYFFEKKHISCVLDQSSQTAVRLLKILLSFFWKKSFEISTQGDARLLIGNQALQEHTDDLVIDLAKIWYEWTQLPFVFGTLCYHPHVCITPIMTWIQDSIDSCFRNKQALLQEASKTILDQNKLDCYFQFLKYRIESKELESIQLFNQLWKHYLELF